MIAESSRIDANDAGHTVSDRRFVVALEDESARSVELTGGKAANLARAAVAGEAARFLDALNLV